MRKDKTNYYLDIADAVSLRGTCLRRNFGAIVVKNDEIVSTGYVGAPRGRENCCDMGFCTREKMQIPPGQRYELCRSVHAEANALLAASREVLYDATLYLTCRDAKTNEIVSGTSSCAMCKRLIINAGIRYVIVRDTTEEFRSIHVYNDWVLCDDSLAHIAREKTGY